jgi:hypothetical protein
MLRLRHDTGGIERAERTRADLESSFEISFPHRAILPAARLQLGQYAIMPKRIHEMLLKANPPA